MKLIKVGSGILNQTPLDWENNLNNIKEVVAAAKEAGVSILCLPELCVTGYGCEDAFLAHSTRAYALESLRQITRETKGIIVNVGLPLFHQSGIYNAVALIVDGRLIGFAAKRFLAGDGIHYEPRWFKPWPKGILSRVEIDDVEYPLGDYLFECGNVRLGFEVCEDAWVADRPGSALALRGADILLNPSASHFAFGKFEVRKRFVLEGSRAFGVSYLYSNLLGNESGRAIYDGGALIASRGKLVAEGRRFGYRNWELTTAIIDVDATRMEQARTGSFDPDLQDSSESTIQVDFDFPSQKLVSQKPAVETWETSPHLKSEEFSRAVALGLFDYLRKSHSKGFVVSLSGGADSSAVASLIWIMTHLGLEELKTKDFIQRLGLTEKITGSPTANAIVSQLLTCVYQGTENSGKITRTAAREVAQAIGATFLELEVGDIVKAYVDQVSRAMARPLSWEKDDIALQNIQARVRSPGVWLIANVRNALLLSTSNRSEVAVGYATMDGDTSGGLCPLGGIDKAFIRQWLKWLEKSGPGGMPGLAALAYVNRQAPTAELRPAAMSQTDEADLMPYEVLDAIERAAIRDKQSPVEILDVLQIAFPNYSGADLETWIARFFTLWCQNQWKRERYAPSFHLDDENLDPRTWCRFPILSGGYRKEISELGRARKRGK